LAPLPGHWAVLGREYIVLQPLALPTPLPADFTVTYDLVAGAKFTWGAKGMTFELGAGKSPTNPESYLRLRLRRGRSGVDEWREARPLHDHRQAGRGYARQSGRFTIRAIVGHRALARSGRHTTKRR
jgi:hypothetical protein